VERFALGVEALALPAELDADALLELLELLPHAATAVAATSAANVTNARRATTRFFVILIVLSGAVFVIRRHRTGSRRRSCRYGWRSSRLPGRSRWRLNH
jgi:hypothetical protein